jgi:hypothetical protein
MKKSVFAYIFIFLFLNLSIVHAENIGNVILTGISKIYIEYENGQYQELVLPSKVNYTFSVTEGTSNGQGDGEKDLIISGELQQNSKIKRIALYIDSFVVEGGVNLPVNGYMKFLSSSFAGETQVPISAWCSGDAVFNDPVDFSRFNYGVIDFNSSASYSYANKTLSISSNAAFDAKNQKVKIRFSNTMYFFSGNPQTQNL